MPTPFQPQRFRSPWFRGTQASVPLPCPLRGSMCSQLWEPRLHVTGFSSVLDIKCPRKERDAITVPSGMCLFQEAGVLRRGVCSPPGPAGHIPNSQSVDHSHPQHSIVGGTRSAGSDATSMCLPRVGEVVSCPPGWHTPGLGGSGQGQGGKTAGLDGHEDLGSLLADTWS